MAAVRAGDAERYRELVERHIGIIRFAGIRFAHTTPRQKANTFRRSIAIYASGQSAGEMVMDGLIGEWKVFFRFIGLPLI